MSPLDPFLATSISRRVSVTKKFYCFDGGSVPKLKMDERDIDTPHLYPN